MTTKKQTSKKLKIVVEHAFGPYASASEAAAAKKKIKAKVKNITLTAAAKTKTGYVMRGRMTYVNAVDAPASMVKQHLQSQMPNAKISVTRA